jgi:lysozyme
MTLVEQLRRDEGVRSTAYQDTGGIWTVGVGHNLRMPLTTDAINQILADDIQAAETGCLALPIWKDLSEARKGVLLNMCFNLGFAGLMQFRLMYAALEARDYARAAAEMLDSRWARQVGARADRLAKQMAEDVWV